MDLMNQNKQTKEIVIAELLNHDIDRKKDDLTKRFRLFLLRAFNIVFLR